MVSELSFAIEISSKDKNFQWDDLKGYWQTKFGGEILELMPSEDNWSFIWRGVNPENILKHAEKGFLDQEIVSRGGSKLIKITEDEECIYEFIPDINFSQKVLYRDVGVGELQAKAAVPGIDLLLMTVTDIERKAVLAEMDPWPGEKEILVGAISYNTYRFGQFGKYRTAQVESTMSNEGRDGAKSTLQDAINELNPKAILLVGIAFGINRRKQHLGDVIIAESVFNYELRREGESSSILRGRETNCSSILSERFRTRRSDWHLHCSKRLINVHQGLLLSGSKLIDSKEFRNQLVNQFQNREPLGGEMEGAGAYEVADRKDAAIILVKGICDWADGHKNNRAQPFAAYAAVSLAKHVLNKPDVLAELGAINVIPTNNSDDTDQSKYDPDYRAILNEFQIGNTVLFLGSGVNLYGREPIHEEILNLFLLKEEEQNQLSDIQKIQLSKAKQSSLSEIELAFILDKKIRELLGKTQTSADLMQTLIGLPCQECYSDITKRPPGCPIWGQLEVGQSSNKKLKGEELNCPLAIEQRLTIAKMNIRFLSQYLQSISSPAALYAMLESFYRDCKFNRLHKSLADLLKSMSVLPFELVVTTNYDNFLEEAFLDARIAFDVVSYVENDPFGKRGFICHSYDQNRNCQPKKITSTTTEFQYPVILKLYGWLKNKEIVMTEDQHIDYLLSNPFVNLIPSHLKEVIKRKSILFLGYSWNDYDLKHILGQSDLKITSNRQTWFIYKSKPGTFLDVSWGNQKRFHPIENTLVQCVDKLESFVSKK